MTERATERFNLRATPEQAARIRAAVESGNERSLTDYILSSALIIADQRLMDRTRLGFNAHAYDAFLRALDEPPKDLPRMRCLLSEPSVLEDQNHDGVTAEVAAPDVATQEVEVQVAEVPGRRDT